MSLTTNNDIIPLKYTVHAVTDRDRAQQRALERQATQEERECRVSEEERFKSLVKLWDSSRSSYATVRLTHRQQHTHTCPCVAEHETQRSRRSSSETARDNRTRCVHLVRMQQRRHTITWKGVYSTEICRSYGTSGTST